MKIEYLFLFEKHRKRIFHPLVHSLHTNSGWGWTRLKPTARTRNPRWVSMGDRDTVAEAISCCFPRCNSREPNWKQSSWYSNWCFYRNLALCYNSGLPIQAFKKRFISTVLKDELGLIGTLPLDTSGSGHLKSWFVCFLLLLQLGMQEHLNVHTARRTRTLDPKGRMGNES